MERCRPRRKTRRAKRAHIPAAIVRVAHTRGIESDGGCSLHLTGLVSGRRIAQGGPTLLVACATDSACARDASLLELGFERRVAMLGRHRMDGHLDAFTTPRRQTSNRKSTRL